MKRTMLIVNHEQFGYHIDYLEYCRYLQTDFDIIYLCWDYNFEKIVINEVLVIYVSRSGNLIQRNARFINSTIHILKRNAFYFVILHYFRGCSIIAFICNKKHRIHLDIRTGGISLNSIKRNTLNKLIRFESQFFRSVSTISSGVKRLLKLNSRAFILPLGANPLFLNRQLNHKMSLLYVGTLSNRRIVDTVIGLGIFRKNQPLADINYVIIGGGWGREMEEIQDKITEYNLEKIVEVKGYVLHHDLWSYFERANVGVSYIPMIPGYEYQPATKTYEYLMAGMSVIATGTYENKKVINEHNGFITNDNPISFATCLELMYSKIDDFNEKMIVESVYEYKWETIISEFKGKIIDIAQKTNADRNI